MKRILVGPAMQWNGFYFPADYTLASLLDRMGCAILEGLAIAAIVKPVDRPLAPT